MHRHIRVEFISAATYNPLMQIDLEVDAIGLLCPLPVLKARKRLQSLEAGQVLCLIADDPAAIVDVPHFCQEAGHQLLSQDTAGTARRYLIRKGQD